MSGFKEDFLHLVAMHAESKLVPFAVMDAKGKVSIYSLALSATESFHFIRKTVRADAHRTWGLAWNRWTRPDQDTTRGSVMTWLVVVDGVPSTGVIEYDEGDQGLIIDPPREDCPFWCAEMSRMYGLLVQSVAE